MGFGLVHRRSSSRDYGSQAKGRLFGNEGRSRSSALTELVMAATLGWWAEPRPGSWWSTGLPADGWVTWVDPRRIRSPNPGWCFQRAGWTRDHSWTHRHLVRLRAQVTAR
jgi:hypothetical protein